MQSKETWTKIIWSLAALVILGVLFGVVMKLDKEKLAAARPDSEEETVIYKDIDLGAGVNIGNSLEVYASRKLDTITDYETYWKNPVITQELMNLIKESGFKVVRIPVTWDQHFTEDGYTIDPAWMARVKEVVDYAYQSELYVIIDAHHDSWITMNPVKYSETEEMAQKVWSQIAQAFAEYDDHLIFEGYNEPKVYEDEGEDYKNEDAYEVLNRLNEVFVETVRKSGANNADRWLIVSTYKNGCTKAEFDALEKITDDKVMVSVHLYTPYKFTGKSVDDAEGTTQWSIDDYASVHTLKENLKNIVRFQKRNKVRVIVTEMGAVDKNNAEARAAWTEYVVSALRKENIPYIWWEDSYTGENSRVYALINRNNNTLLHPELVDILIGEK